MENSIINLWTYFLVYSIAGWFMESVFRSISERKIINTGFLYGPFCPIYGCGAIIMLIFLKNLQEKTLILFLASFVVLSLWEYLVGVFLERVFKNKYWDYSDHKYNIKGRVCLTNSIYWGFLGTVFIKYLHPFLMQKVDLIDNTILYIIVSIITIIFFIDTIISIVKTKNIKSTLEKINDLNKQIKEKIEEINSKDYKIEIKESLNGKINELKDRKNKIYKNLYKRVNRLKKAFPTIDSKEITEILNKRIDLIKKEKKEKR